MKLILSRKGFDSAAGGGPSPLLPDGTLLSLPIPSRDARRYRDLPGPGMPLSRMLEQLGVPRRIARGNCHLDPDLDPTVAPRSPGWRPSFGSVGAAGTHLANHGVGPGDLFLFFGWFRPAHVVRRRWRYQAGPDRHIIFGYLQVGEVHRPAGAAALPRWLRDHPHAERIGAAGNVIFTAAEQLSLPALPDPRPGAGLLPFHESRVLTAPGLSRSRWQLPPAVFSGREISYHRASAWREGYFQSAGRGQEFVIDADADVLAWALAMTEARPAAAVPGNQPMTGAAVGETG